jgi:hypothetical protein
MCKNRHGHKNSGTMSINSLNPKLKWVNKILYAGKKKTINK